MAREINLVPDIKNDMIRTLKLRNLVFFISIVVGITCAVVLAVLGSIVGGQEIAKTGKETTLKLMSAKVENSADDLKDYLTIRDQLSDLKNITGQKQVLSRTFNILGALLPTGADTIKISELTVNLANENPTFSFDAQADAGREPFIDYNVLDSFKKSMEYMYYDYGTYVDKDDNEIPAYCIIETGEDGETLRENGSYYAYWTIAEEGCNPGDAEYQDPVDEDGNPIELVNDEEEEETEQNSDSGNSTLNNVLGNTNVNSRNSNSDNDEDENSDDEDVDSGSSSSSSSNSNSKKRVSKDAYETTVFDDTQVVKIWRTPQFEEWYKDEHIDLSGQISGIPHFNSQCITYSGTLDEKDSKTIKWNDDKTCHLVPSNNNESGIKISDSSNGRGAGDELVLRFSAVITLDPAVYQFNNFHMLAIPPADRVNVTDSYVQIQNMFSEPARACDPTDTACISNTQNLNGGNS